MPLTSMTLSDAAGLKGPIAVITPACMRTLADIRGFPDPSTTVPLSNTTSSLEAVQPRRMAIRIAVEIRMGKAYHSSIQRGILVRLGRSKTFIRSFFLMSTVNITKYVRYTASGQTSFGILDGDTVRELRGNIFETTATTGKTFRLADV